MSFHEQQSQPLITQQAYKQSDSNNIRESQQKDSSLHMNKQQPSNQIPKESQVNVSQELFFQVMDSVDQYDLLIKEMNELYTQGMLAIANVKFINPYSSLSTKGYKPTPSITKVMLRESSANNDSFKCNESLSPAFTLITQTKNLKFTNSVIDSINFSEQPQRRHVNNQDSEQQSQASLSTANQLYSYQQEQLILQQQQVTEACRKLTEQQTFSKQQFLLNRFNIETQKDIVRQGMNNFQLLLQKLLQMAQMKINIEKKFDKMQTSMAKK